MADVYDPTEALFAILSMSTSIHNDEEMPPAAKNLAAAIDQLSEYIAAGGDLPKQWDPCFDCDQEQPGTRRCLRHGKLMPLRRPTYVPGA